MTPADAPIGLGQLAYAPPGVPGAPVQLVVAPVAAVAVNCVVPAR